VVSSPKKEGGKEKYLKKEDKGEVGKKSAYTQEGSKVLMGKSASQGVLFSIQEGGKEGKKSCCPRDKRRKNRDFTKGKRGGITRGRSGKGKGMVIKGNASIHVTLIGEILTEKLFCELGREKSRALSSTT